MRVVVAGGHGQIGLRLLRLLADGGHEPVGLIRKAEQAGDEVFAVYLQAKARADDELRASGLDYTIVRPGGLTDDPGTGRVRIGERLERGHIPRDDVAAVLYAALDRHLASGATFDLVGGDDQIEEALSRLGG